MRHSNPGYCVVPWKVKPALVKASKPERTGWGAHRTCTPSPKAVMSTTTVMPVELVQAPADGAAGEGDAGEAAATGPSATSAPKTASATRQVRAVISPSAPRAGGGWR